MISSRLNVRRALLLTLMTSGLCLGGWKQAFVWASPQPVKNEKAAAPEAPEAPERKKVFNAETFTLDNGLEVIVVPNHRAPVVTHMVWYKVGGADEPWGKSGIAHFLEHLMFKGSDRVGGPPLGPGEFSQIVRALGGNDNAFTSKDYTAFFQSVPAEHLETVMRMEAGRMSAISAPQPHVESERKVILEERRQRTDNDPRERFQEQMLAQAFPNHPYGIPVIGWKHEIETLSWDDLKRFHDAWYTPNNALLIVTGDVDPARVYQLAIDIYGPIPRKDVPERRWARSPSLPSPGVFTLKDPLIQEPSVQTVFRAPGTRMNKTDALALEVLAEIMAGGSSGRLYQALVVDQKIATDAGLSYDSHAREDAQVWLYGTPAPGHSLEELNAALNEQLRLVVRKGVRPEELQSAITRLQDETVYALDSLSGPAMTLGFGLTSGSTLEDLEYWPYDVAAITAEQVQAVAKKYLNPDAALTYPPVTGYLEPETPAKDDAPQAPAPSPANAKGGVR